MNIAEQLNALYKVAVTHKIEISEINEADYRFKCAILKDNKGYLIVLNLPHIKDKRMKKRALKWAIECCIDESKTDWRDLNDIPTDASNRP